MTDAEADPRGRPEPRGGDRPRDGGAGAREAGVRKAILGRVRRALEERTAVEHPGALSFPEPEGPLADIFQERFRAEGGQVVELAGLGGARSWLEEFAAGFETAAAGRDLPDALRPALPEAPAAEADLGVSMAPWAAADTGSLLLDSREGRRGQLLPPVHLVWVERERIVATLAEALERAADEKLPAALALHSGPSKSADIGRILVTGIHGPGRVVAVVVGEAAE